MNPDRDQTLRARAARHAALGDSSRLRITDLLTLGDLSPTEIRVALGLPSNLISHHLTVLETAGIVTRSRSEADGRRIYLRLTDTALDGLIPGSTHRAARVLFVCTANSARSQLAAALWPLHSAIPAASAGTHPAERVDPGAIAAATRHDLALPGGRPRRLADVIVATDLVVTVCDSAHEELDAAGSLHWSIPDPVRVGTDDAFDRAYVALERRIADLALRVG